MPLDAKLRRVARGYFRQISRPSHSEFPSRCAGRRPVRWSPLVVAVIGLSWFSACSSGTPVAEATGESQEPQLAAPLDLRDADLVQSVAAIGEAVQRPIVMDQEASELASCARLTLYVPAGTSTAIAEASLTSALAQQGLTLREEDDTLVLARDSEATITASCQATLDRARTPSRRSRLADPFGSSAVDPLAGPPLGGSSDLKDPFAPLEESNPLLDVVEIDETHFEITRASLDAVDSTTLAKQARIVPAMQDGVIKGYKLYGIRPASIPKLLGLKNGDLITSIAGISLVDLDTAMSAFAKIKTAKSVPVVIERRGESITMTYTIR